MGQYLSLIHILTAKVDSRTPARLGDHIKLAIDPEKVHVFDKETELTITN